MAGRDLRVFAILALSLVTIASIAIVSSDAVAEGPEGFFDNDICYEIYGDDAVVVRRASTTPEITIPKMATDPETHRQYTVRAIEAQAFSRDKDLVTVNFEKGCLISTIEDFAMDDCPNLVAVHLENLNELNNIAKDAFSGDSSLVEVTIPDSVTSIWDWAFDGCHSLKRVNLGSESQLDTIMNYAFANCSSLESISFPPLVRYIGPSAFAGCTSLRSVSFAEGSQLETIDICAFLDCDSMTDIRFPKLTEFVFMGAAAFGYTKGGMAYDYDFANEYGGSTFVLPKADVSMFEGNKYHREAGSTVFTKSCDVTFEGYGTVSAYVGCTVERPQLPERSGMVLTGWYLDGRIWSFEKDVVQKDMTLIPKWAIVEEGSTVIETDTEVDVQISKDLESITVLFSSGRTVSVDAYGMSGSLHISSYDLADGRFEILTEWSDGTKYSGTILASVPIDEKAGTPSVYLYEGDDKTEMPSVVIGGTLYFVTTHNSTYGVEYGEEGQGSPVALGYLIVIVALAAFVLMVAAAALSRYRCRCAIRIGYTKGTRVILSDYTQ